MTSPGKLSKRVVLPCAVLVAGALGTVTLVSVRPDVDTRPLSRPVPLVRAAELERSAVQVSVRAQGSVTPRTESDLVAEVSGRITWVSPRLASGGFVEPDEVLVRIDAGDYEVAAERAEAALTRAQSEHDAARSDLSRRENLASRGVSSSSQLEDAGNAERVASAALRDARAALRQARRDLERTAIAAPFAGRVREKKVDVGQFVSRGMPLARLYAVDYAEIRLPLSDEDAAFVDLPFNYRGDVEEADGPTVHLRARFAGRDYRWTGRIVRTEGEIDPRTRMIHAVARVEDPYGRSGAEKGAPLAVGLFVEAEIEGRILDDVYVVPRAALRGRGEVAVIDAEDRLRMRPVDVLRRERDRVLVSSGFQPGDRVCSSPLAVAVDGMLVRVASPDSSLHPTTVAEVRSGS